ncbi:MAG: formate dehydrogenase accessory sulfurtransferase FdhD [Acidobacteriota bacterium]|nr:formate dehydrogenase accessory sulfurtransferase FdhD [Acidobacteriota bacterium]
MERNILSVPVERVEDGASVSIQDLLAVEEPLEIRIGERAISITMRTPGNDFELAAGFLFSESVIGGREAIERIHSGTPNTVTIDLKPGIEVDLDRLARHFYTSSSCGVCGKASLAALAAQGCRIFERTGPLFHSALIPELSPQLRRAQRVFEYTGGLHAAALFDTTGRLEVLREDVGRHNALDKLIGAEMLAGRTPLTNRLLLVSGRASFELMQKALMAGIPVLAAVGAPSSLAVEVAQRYNMTLLGFVRAGRFNVYSGAWRMK